MADALKPGNISPKAQMWINDPQFTCSMAQAMEDALNTLMVNDDLPALDTDASQTSVRDRRRLFVAIARGVVSHLQAHKAAITLFCEDNQTKPVSGIAVDY
ncbi:MAG: hypothetical protein JWM38_2335 [Sphingomonas bacterium]|nr:hypothetical protein [Sphingomonas bacterium]